MVEDIYGEALHTHFEDAECEPDLMHVRGIECIECSSIENGDDSNADEIKELFAEPALPANTRVLDVESAGVDVDSTPPAVSRVQDNRCTAGILCGTKIKHLAIGGHVCLGCHKKVHGYLCRSLRSEI